MTSSDIYVTAAFKSVRQNEVYIFMQNEYVLCDYAPGKKYDKILYGPAHIGAVFSSLECTIFGELGITCAFASHDLGIAYIFSGNICAKWYYGLYSPNNKILEGPKLIVEMFPFLNGTVFANGIDAAFESSRPFEAYLFKGDQCARINYSANGQLINNAPIRQNWPCFKGTIFEHGIDASFASHNPHQAYVFKGDLYARIRFIPGVRFDVLISTGRIKDYWMGLQRILPRKNTIYCSNYN
ncbi:albumin-2-like [Chenopodium quinoa]|uniref:albumin-2-like n=1 Tax=Chenopodium quinoa TaxID=63459 RepID=UPI000B78E16E|nr:albumin-2-like [Chenopodium quinoa]XP_021730231.1 albumin-2-like [Chenopodium quinoa]